MLFIDRLIERIIETKNPSVVGLDTNIEFVPEGIRESCVGEFGAFGHRAASEAIYRFNCAIIDNIKDIVPAVKPQLAFYELYGSSGAEAYAKTADYARKNGMIVIADGKRADIGSTAAAYANAYLGGGGSRDPSEACVADNAPYQDEACSAGNAPYQDEACSAGNAPNRDGYAYFADALTINPYLGYDGIEPFIANCKQNSKGVFILIKTSNPSSGDFQDLEISGGGRLYERVADKVAEWAAGDGLLGAYGYSSVCAVVGATYPSQAKKLRERLKRVYFLVPGYGAQGGSSEDAAAAFDGSGLGAIVNASRSVLCAWSHERWSGAYTHCDFAEAARAEALRMRSEINRAIGAPHE
jgi:orotidine-5'-phosphate decarboxylase